MKKMVVGCLLLVAVGREVAIAAPAWCAAEGVNQHEMRYSSVTDALDPDPSDALPAIVASLCWPDAEAKDRVKEIEKARAAWSKKLDLQEADWTDVAQYASTTKSMRQGSIPVDHEKKQAWTTLSPIEQFSGIENGFPNNGNGNSISEYTYLTDALGTKLSETGRLAYIQQACLGYNRSIAEWAMCEPDLALLDRKKIADEIRKDAKAKGLDRMKIRLYLHGLDTRLAEHAKEVEKARAKEAAYAKMFEMAAATRKEWDGIWKSETALLELALTMDDARQTSSRKSLEGCSEKTWAAWKAVVEKIPAKNFEGFSTGIADSWMSPAAAVITTTVPGYLASTALFNCHRATAEKDPVISTIGSVMGFVPGLRGPRTSTLWALRNANLQLDDASEQIDFPQIRYDQKYKGSEARGYFATVAKIKVDGDKAIVSFTPKFEKQEQCSSARRTNRITQIRPDGSLIYESICTQWKSVTVDRSPDAQTVDVRYTAGVKPGMNVNISTGAIFGAWAKGKKSPSVVAGVTVK
jgi:hypothetical protein